MAEAKRVSDRFDWALSFYLFLFFLISCVAIYSGQSSNQYAGNFVNKQIINYVVGIIIIAVMIHFDSEQLRRMAWFLYGVGIILLIGLFVAPETIAPERKGATLWYVIPGVGFSFQPSEFVKVFLIIALSKVIVDHREKHLNKSLRLDVVLLMKLAAVTAVPLGLIIIEDLGTAIVIFAIFTGIVFVSGVSWKLIIPIFTLGGTLAGSVLYLVIKAPEVIEKYLGVDPYQSSRITSWLDPYTHKLGAGMQLFNSMKAIGSGQIYGVGFAERKVYVPDSHTDFIFSVIGEEYGFVGSAVVIGLFFLLIYHLARTAVKTSDPFNSYISVGVISMITFHVFQNIGMTIQVLPITGIPLPFISYGGSSLMGNMLAMGLIFGIRYHHKEYMFSMDRKVA